MWGSAFCLPGTPNLNYNFQAKNFFSQPDRDADQHAFGLDNYLFFIQNRAYALFSYRLEQQDTEGSQFEYLGHYFTAGIDVPVPVLASTPKIKMSYQYYFRDYENVTPSIGENRDDSRHTVSVGMSLPVSEIWVAKLDYQHIEAISNLETFDFNENILSLSLGAIF